MATACGGSSTVTTTVTTEHKCDGRLSTRLPPQPALPSPHDQRPHLAQQISGQTCWRSSKPTTLPARSTSRARSRSPQPRSDSLASSPAMRTRHPARFVSGRPSTRLRNGHAHRRAVRALQRRRLGPKPGSRQRRRTGRVFRPDQNAERVGEVGFRGRQVISFEPDVHPPCGELGFDGFTGDPEVEFLTELDGTPLHISVELDGVFENSVGIIIYEMTLSDIGSSHQADLPEEYFIKYTSRQELPFTVGYPRHGPKTETQKPSYSAVRSVNQSNLFPICLGLTRSRWTSGRPLRSMRFWKIPTRRLDRDQTIALGPDARVWRIVDGTIQFESGPLYFIYAAALADGGRH